MVTCPILKKDYYIENLDQNGLKNMDNCNAHVIEKSLEPINKWGNSLYEPKS
jgi:hypothetical protein